MPTCSLREHSARLTQDDGGWVLRYPIARHQYGSREVELVEVMIPLVAENYAGAGTVWRVTLSRGTYRGRSTMPNARASPMAY